MDRKIEHIVVHCSDTYSDMNVGAMWIDRLHKSFGWTGGGYHFVVNRNGAIEKGRDVNTPGAHAKGFSKYAIGVCWIGGKGSDDQPEDNRTLDQLKSLRVLLDTLTHTFPDAIVCGHRDLPSVNKACPCFDVENWYYGS